MELEGGPLEGWRSSEREIMMRGVAAPVGVMGKVCRIWPHTTPINLELD